MHGARDYSNLTGIGNLYQLYDLAELAVRLGSLIDYDRRGQLVWVYSFDDGLSPVIEWSNGSGSVLLLATGVGHRGAFRAQLTAGPDVGRYAGFYKIVPTSNDKVMSVFCWFHTWAAKDEFYLNLYHYTGYLQFLTYLMFDFVHNTVKVRTVEDNHLDLNYPISDIASASYFAYAKVVCDLNTHQLVRAQINNDGFNLAGKSMPYTSDTLFKGVMLRCSLVNREADSNTAVVDTVGIMTNDA